MAARCTGEKPLTEEGYVTWPSMDPSGTRVYYLMRTEASQGQASGELWSMDLASRRRQRLFPELLMAHYSLSRMAAGWSSPPPGHEAATGSGLPISIGGLRRAA